MYLLHSTRSKSIIDWLEAELVDHFDDSDNATGGGGGSDGGPPYHLYLVLRRVG